MNLPVIFRNATKTISNAAGAGFLIAKKHAPELMIGSGIAGFVLTVVSTVKATNKTNDILENKEHTTKLISTEMTENPEYTFEMGEAALKDLKKQTRRQLVKAWMPVGTMGLASVILILGGYKIVNGRYVATASAYKMLETSFDHYRSNVRREYGNDTDWRMANGYTAEELEQIQKERREQAEAAETAKKRGNKKPRKRKNYQQSYIFDEYSNHWKRYWTPRQFLDYIQFKTQELQDKFEIQGYLFLNDVLEAFGLEKTAEGQIVGWIKKRGKTTRISVGYDEAPEEEIRRILATERNEDLRWWLTPNTDGVIYSLIDSIDRQDRYLLES